jgi:hypothetical protein
VRFSLLAGIELQGPGETAIVLAEAVMNEAERVVSSQLSVLSCQLSVVSCQLSVVSERQKQIPFGNDKQMYE